MTLRDGLFKRALWAARIAAPDLEARSSAHSFGWIRLSPSRAFLTASLVAALRLGSSAAFGQIVEMPIAEDPVALDSGAVSGKVCRPA